MYADTIFPDEPLWSRRPARRLAWFLLPAIVIVAAVLASLRLPVANIATPLPELLVRIVAESLEDVVDTETPEPAVEASPPTPSAPTDRARAVEAQAGSRTDWLAEIPAAVQATLDAPTYSINPGFDARREAAAEQFRRSETSTERPIWENVERDQLGRLILASGDCYRVLDDPRVTHRDEFLTFGQFLAFCSSPARTPQLLAFVAEIKSRRASQVRYARRVAE